MADKKISNYTEKVTIVDDDLVEIFDSEEAVISEQNKKVKYGTLKTHIQSSGPWVFKSLPGGSPTLISPFGRFVKTGIMVHIEWQFTVPVNVDGAQVFIGNLPFTSVDTALATGMVLAVGVGTKVGTTKYQGCKIAGDEIKVQFHDFPTQDAWSWQNASDFFVAGSLDYITDGF